MNTIHLPIDIVVVHPGGFRRNLHRLRRLVARPDSTLDRTYRTIDERLRAKSTYYPRALAARATVWARPLAGPHVQLDVGGALLHRGCLMIWVDAHARRQGVGRALVEALLKHAKSRPKVWRGTDGAHKFWSTFGDRVQ